jgi:hypothetical protein
MNEERAQIDLNDFTTVVSIIDTCTERGAFKGNELLVVGQIRERFANFVNANAQKAPETVEDEQIDDESVDVDQ